MAPDDVLTRDEAAAYLKIGRSTLNKLMKSGGLRYIKLTRKVLFRKADIDRWLDAKAKAAK